jgi:MFS family permease
VTEVPSPLANPLANPLGSAPFRWLVTGSTIGRLGSAIAPVALAFAVLDLTGSATSVGIVTAARSIALVVFILIGGVVADRLPRRLVMVGASLASAVTQAAVAAVVIARTDSVALLAALSAVNGAVAAFSAPASAAVLPQTVPSAALQKANALSRLGVNGANVIGLSFTGIIIVAAGSGWAIAIDAATYAASAVCFVLMRIEEPKREPRRPGADGRSGDSFLRELHVGWKTFVSYEWIWVVVAAFTLINAVVVGATVVLGPVFADDTIGRSEWGIALGAQAVGYVAGGVIAMRLVPRRLMAFGMLCAAPMALPIFAMAGHFGFWPLLVLFFIDGLAIEQFGVAWQISLQRYIPGDYLARVSSYDALGSWVAIPIGQIAAGPISGVIGMGPTLVGAGVVILLAVAASLLSRSVRTLGTTPAPDAAAVPAA